MRTHGAGSCFTGACRRQSGSCGSHKADARCLCLPSCCFDAPGSSLSSPLRSVCQAPGTARGPKGTTEAPRRPAWRCDPGFSGPRGLSSQGRCWRDSGATALTWLRRVGKTVPGLQQGERRKLNTEYGAGWGLQPRSSKRGRRWRLLRGDRRGEGSLTQDRLSAQTEGLALGGAQEALGHCQGSRDSLETGLGFFLEPGLARVEGGGEASSPPWLLLCTASPLHVPLCPNFPFA